MHHQVSFCEVQVNKSVCTSPLKKYNTHNKWVAEFKIRSSKNSGRNKETIAGKRSID